MVVGVFTYALVMCGVCSDEKLSHHSLPIACVKLSST